MDDLLDRLMGVDKKNEIFNLWFELNFLRHCFNSILSLNPDIHKDFDEKWLERCRELAAEEVRNRFPHCVIDFLKPKSPEERKEEKDKEINDLLGAMEKVLTPTASQTEDPSYMTQAPEEAHSSSQSPSNEPSGPL